ncbi:MAG TPA: hypothetical protein VMH28_16030 [Candidatus Acidoferrales bacterium]|nr:hypothetical protein [Candidatus Acidoferrales bacterium]
MRNQSLYWIVFIGAFFTIELMAQPLPAQSVDIPISVQQTMTTGMAGLTLNQTARLSVLNLNPVPMATTNVPANCNVQMQFVDSKNNSLKQSTLTNFAPQTATSLDLNAASMNIAGLGAQRAQIRGVVTVNPALPASNTVVPGYCTVMVTLEIFDNTTGNTVALTTDARVISHSGILPFMITNGNRD